MTQCWNIVNSTLGRKSKWFFFDSRNAFVNVVCKMATILSRPQCVNAWRCICTRDRVTVGSGNGGLSPIKRQTISTFTDFNLRNTFEKFLCAVMFSNPNVFYLHIQMGVINHFTKLSILMPHISKLHLFAHVNEHDPLKPDWWHAAVCLK